MTDYFGETLKSVSFPIISISCVIVVLRSFISWQAFYRPPGDEGRRPFFWSNKKVTCTKFQLVKWFMQFRMHVKKKQLIFHPIAMNRVCLMFCSFSKKTSQFHFCLPAVTPFFCLTTATAFFLFFWATCMTSIAIKWQCSYFVTEVFILKCTDLWSDVHSFKT